MQTEEVMGRGGGDVVVIVSRDAGATGWFESLVRGWKAKAMAMGMGGRREGGFEGGEGGKRWGEARLDERLAVPGGAWGAWGPWGSPGTLLL